MRPSRSRASLNSLAWLRPFWPVVASMTSTTLTGILARLRVTFTTLASSLHEVGGGVQAAGRVDEHEVGVAALRLLDDVVADARRIAAALARDDVHAGALAPDLELLDGRGTEGVGAAQKDAPALPRRATGELAAR